MDTELAKLPEMANAVAVLEAALETLVSKFGRPEFRAEKGKQRFRYKATSPLHLQALKGVRVVSALNALIILLERGFTQEMGVLLRTVDDFLAEIDFVTEAVRSGQPTADQKRFIETFFSEEMRTTEELLAIVRGPYRVVRSKIQASEGRQLGGADPHGTKTMTKAVDEVLSEYVHGSYPCIMELYAGGAWKFHVRGVLGSPFIAMFRKQVAIYIHRTLNVFAGLFHQLRQNEEFEKLITVRKIFEKTDAYADCG